jgi:hypothetical protein
LSLKSRFIEMARRLQRVNYARNYKYDPKTDTAKIKLSADEALVLFELLSRWSDSSDAPTPDATCFESTAEGAVLNMVLCDLEKQLVAPFRQEYEELLSAARTRLEISWDYPTLKG